MIHDRSERIAFDRNPALGILQCGDADGRPVFYFHGFPGSRLEIKLAGTAARRLGIRLIGVDRPGYGLSAARPRRSLLDWPGDILRLADYLGHEHFTVLGVSGGGPYAAACAYKIPQRLNAVGIAGGLGPVDGGHSFTGMEWYNRAGLKIAGLSPALLSPALALIRWMLRRRPEKALRFVVRRAGKPDAEFLRQPELFAVMRDSFRESMRIGIQGALDDLRIYGRPWPFSPKDVRVRVYLWHGEKDRLVPVAMGRRSAASFADCRARFYADEGHFSLVVNRMTEILRDLTNT